MRKKTKKIIIISLFLLTIWITYNIENNMYKKQEEEKQQNFFERKKDAPVEISYDEEDYFMVLEIPKINLKKGLYDKNSPYNSVDSNIAILKESDMPDIEQGNLILAGHRGNTKNAYFNNLHQLKLDDEIYIYYNNKKYTYAVKDIYDDDKDGKVEVHRDYTKTGLVLITCKKNDSKNHSVFIANQIDISKY